MSPAAFKYRTAINSPVIPSAFSEVPVTDFDSMSHSLLSIAHSSQSGKQLLQDWMRFTNVLNSGILHKIS